ncbi:Hypothetical protein CINCED_3A018345 [Cinara cedri]|uniref:Insect cuticle protein n=1 Tax=Cinara cedri TaxID=506608 RepID=A0A5E4MHJ6_9HEMI|nr:Hypothetical protein CINCED_3A018345 [Cinara cedri]
MTFYSTIIISFIVAVIVTQHASCYPSGEHGGIVDSIAHALTGDSRSSEERRHRLCNSSGHEHINVIEVNNREHHRGYDHDVDPKIVVVEQPPVIRRDHYGNICESGQCIHDNTYDYVGQVDGCTSDECSMHQHYNSHEPSLVVLENNSNSHETHHIHRPHVDVYG